MKQFVVNVWNGKTYSLGKHYWLFLWVPSAVMGIIAAVLTFLFGSYLAAVENPIWDAWLAAWIGVTAIGYVGLINCARRERWRGWAITAVIFATLGILTSLAQLTKPFERSEIANEISELNRTLPKRLDEVTTFSKAYYDDKAGVLTYVYQLDDNGQPTLDDAELKANLVRDVCVILKGKYSNVKKIFSVYKMSGRPDRIVQVVAQQDCL